MISSVEISKNLRDVLKAILTYPNIAPIDSANGSEKYGLIWGRRPRDCDGKKSIFILPQGSNEQTYSTCDFIKRYTYRVGLTLPSQYYEEDWDEFETYWDWLQMVLGMDSGAFEYNADLPFTTLNPWKLGYFGFSSELSNAGSYTSTQDKCSFHRKEMLVTISCNIRHVSHVTL